MIRVLLIARYLQMVNHRKVMALAAQPDLELWHIAPRRWSDGLRTYEQELQQAKGYHFIALDTWSRPGDIHRFIYWPPTLCLPDIRPDLIHLEEEPDSLAALEAVIARDLWARSARFVLFTWQNIRRKRSIMAERIARFVLQRTDQLIAGNQEAANVIRAQGYTKAVSRLPQLGVDTTTFRLQDARALRAQLNLTGFVVGYVGRFVPEKGLDTLLRAVAQVESAQALLVGRGPMQRELESLAHALGMAERLTFVNAVPHHAVPLYLNAMDALVLPSRSTPNWKEQFGHVLIEAMACGVPVVGAESGAIPEVIESAGLIFRENDAQALAECLRDLLYNAEKREQLRQRGLARVADHYSHQRIAEQTASIYRAVLER